MGLQASSVAGTLNEIGLHRVRNVQATSAQVGVEALAIKKSYIRIPPFRQLSPGLSIVRALVGGVLAPIFLVLAYCYGLPGLRFRLDFARMGMRFLFRPDTEISATDIYRLLFWPMHFTRYFEFDFMWRALADTPVQHYLDVSSPRWFPIFLLSKRCEARGVFVNPDAKDLKDTGRFIRACGLDARCQLRDSLIQDVQFVPQSFDLITAISVVEHIPQDKEAVIKMWKLLRRGGRLLLSVPCSAVAEEQYVDLDQFGLQPPDQNEFFFHQHIYDDELLADRLYSVMGPPTRWALYGERNAGSLLKGLLQYWSGGGYPLWKEPYTMAREFRRYDKVSDLPGEGVICMEFVKE